MGERSDQITRQIEETRSDLGSNLQELETKVKDVTDWRKQFQKSPLTMIGIAFGGGILLSRMLGGGSRHSRRYRSRDFDDGHKTSSHRQTAGTRYEMKKAVDTWDSAQVEAMVDRGSGGNAFTRAGSRGAPSMSVRRYIL